MNILIEASLDVDQNIKTNNYDKDQFSIEMIDDDMINKMMNITNNDDDDDDTMIKKKIMMKIQVTM